MNTRYTIQGQTGAWELVVGMEVHAQTVSNSKLFSGASTQFGQTPNDNVSFVDAGFPGMLPVINRVCVEQAIRTGLGLNAVINTYSVFDRKNYFYPDLPSGYQISQYKHPIVGEGAIAIDLTDGTSKTIRIERLHLEQDAGKSIHDQHPQKSYVDLNRSGVALMEIVSYPDITSPEEAAAYVRKLQMILRYLGTCDGNMEEGNMRCDVNVSVRRAGAPLGTRCEIKNVNSVRFICQAIDYEAERQIAILEQGGVIEQETRLFDADKGVTRSMRSKEDAHDYRYFPDPDLLPLHLHPDDIARIQANLPELPDAKKARFASDYGLNPEEIGLLIADRETAEFYEQLATKHKPKLAANWVVVELFSILNKQGASIQQSPVSIEALSGLLTLIEDNTISGRIAKDVFAKMVETGLPAAQIVEQDGLTQVTDSGAIEQMIMDILNAHPDKVTDYRAGKEKLFGFFVGQVMKASAGKANPAAVNDILKAKLQGK